MAEIDEPDEGFEQFFELGIRSRFRERNSRLGRPRIGKSLVGIGKRNDTLAVLIDRIDQLQYPDDLVFVVLHRNVRNESTVAVFSSNFLVPEKKSKPASCRHRDVDGLSLIAAQAATIVLLGSPRSFFKARSGK